MLAAAHPSARPIVVACLAVACLAAACLSAAPGAAGPARAEGAAASTGPAGEANPSGLPIPRWVSLRADPVNLRTGPGVRYPIEWVFVRKGLPVEVVGEFESWRQIRAQDGTTGWVHQTMLSGRRTATIADGGTRLLGEPASDAAVTAFVEPGVMGSLERCAGEWCRLVLDRYEVGGWIPRKALWGVYDGENLQ